MQGLTAYNLKIVAEVLGGKAYPLQLLNLLDGSPLIVDLGANIGSFSLACHTLRPDVRLVAVEPDPGNFSALKANLATTNAVLHQAALTGCDGKIDLFLGEQDTVANSTFSGKMVLGQSTITVQGLKTSVFLEEVTQRHGKISLLKSDTEGGEWYLLDLPDNFLAAIPIIYIEYHSSTFLGEFLPRMLRSHVIYSGAIRFPHRGEIALLRKDWVSSEQASYEIRPSPMQS
jgi:FkbM family methyltransferase